MSLIAPSEAANPTLALMRNVGVCCVPVLNWANDCAPVGNVFRIADFISPL